MASNKNLHKFQLHPNTFQILLNDILAADLTQVQTFTIAEYSSMDYQETGRRITLIVQPQGVDLRNHNYIKRKSKHNR